MIIFVRNKKSSHVSCLRQQAIDGGKIETIQGERRREGRTEKKVQFSRESDRNKDGKGEQGSKEQSFFFSFPSCMRQRETVFVTLDEMSSGAAAREARVSPLYFLQHFLQKKKKECR